MPAQRVIVWVPSDGPRGWEVEGVRPHVARWVGGGVRSMHELALAIASSGRRVELRGAVHLPTLDELADAVPARPDLPARPRRLEAGDVVIVPEGIDDPAVHACLALSPARTILMMLGPPGLIGWPFVAGWSRPDPLTVDVEAVARPEHFRGAAALGHELWTLSPGLRDAARAAGVECRFVGSGWPGGVPDLAVEKDVDVVTMRDNRWAPLAAPVVRALRDGGLECAEVPAVDHERVLGALARARIFLHPSRIEGRSRLGCEARALGAVPVVLNTNPYAVGFDEAGGSVALPSTDDMPGAIRDLVADRDLLARLSAAARASARRELAWEPYVERVVAALDHPPANPGRAALSEVGAALERGGRVRPRARAAGGTASRADATIADALADAHDELARHKLWLNAVNGSLSWRLTAPLRSGGTARLARFASRPRGPGRPGDTRTQADRSRAALFERPAGRLDGPAAESPLPRVPVRVFGWCLFPGTSVARVEVVVDGTTVRRARLGVERQDVAELAAHRDAPISGFELMVDLGELPPDRDAVTLHAVAYSVDGRRLSLAPLTLALEPVADASRWAALPRREPDFARAPRPLQGDTRPLRVVAFSHELSYSGASLYLSELLLRLKGTGEHEFTVVSFDDGPLRAKLTAGGIPVHLTSPPPLGSAVTYEHRQAELRAWLAPQRFDAALVNTVGAFPGADAALELGIPTVWSIHESLDPAEFWATAFPPGEPHPHVRARVEHSFGEAAALVFPARATEQLFAGYAEADRLLTIPYGIELPDLDAARWLNRPRELRRHLGIAADARIVLCLGSIEPRKAQAMLAQAFALVAPAHPDAQLLLVGKSESGRRGAYVRGLEEYLLRSGLTSRVRVEPVTDDPYVFHCLADVVVCSSDVESLPRSVVEAMAFEKPVLSTAVYGVPELIDDGVTGYLCETSEMAALASGLDRVLRADPTELEAVARAGSARVRERHDPRRQAAAFADLLDAAVAESRAGSRLTLAAP